MADKKQVITHLQIMHTWATFAIQNDMNFFTIDHMKSIAEWTNDVLELLKDELKEA